MKTSQSGSARKAVQIIVAAGVALGAAPAIADQIFLEISDPRIAGESTDKAHKDWIDIESYQHYFPEKVCSQVYLTKRLDKSSVPLAEASAIQKRISKAKLSVVKSGEMGSIEYFTLEFQGVIVSGYSLSLAESGYESLALTPLVLKMSYKPISPNGTVGSPIERTFNCTTGATK